MSTFKSRVLASLSSEVDASTVALFRIAFGAVMLGWSIVYLLNGDVGADFIEPRFYFSYAGLEWIKPLPGWGMYPVFAGLCAASFGIMTGLWFRASAALFTILFTYTFLADMANYQNHFYLICLLGAIFTLVPTRGKAVPETMPGWGLALLRFQLAVPYFFGALAKVNSDWLQGQPMRTFLGNRGIQEAWLDALVSSRGLALFMSWTGLVFDALIVPGLAWRRSRPFAMIALLIFHLTNSALFTIDVFPYLMLAATVVFFEPDWGRKTWPFRLLWPSARRPRTRQDGRKPVSGLLLAALALHAVIQLCVPARVFFIPGNVSWHEVGHYFSWHMMLRSKRGTVSFHASDPENGKTWLVDPLQYISRRQARRLLRSPEMIWQFSHYLGDRLSEGRPGRVRLGVESRISFNGRRPQPMIDPTVDLGTAPDAPLAWVLPLTQPFEE